MVTEQPCCEAWKFLIQTARHKTRILLKAGVGFRQTAFAGRVSRVLGCLGENFWQAGESTKELSVLRWCRRVILPHRLNQRDDVVEFGWEARRKIGLKVTV